MNEGASLGAVTVTRRSDLPQRRISGASGWPLYLPQRRLVALNEIVLHFTVFGGKGDPYLALDGYGSAFRI